MLELQTQGKLLLDKMERYQAVDPGRVEELVKYMAKMRPQDGKVFKTVSAPPLNLP